MIKISRCLFHGTLFFSLLFIGLSCVQKSTSVSNENEVDPLQYVDPFIGTIGSGNVFPGAALPFSMVNVSPDVVNPTSPSGYISNTPVVGFSHNHMSGCGIKRGHGNLLVFPQVDSLKLHPSEMVKDEVASPGYYAATFGESGVRAEMTLSARSGVHQYTFPKGNTDRILFNVTATIMGSSSHCTAARARFISDKEIEGQASFESEGGSSAYTAYFVGEFTNPVASKGVWKGGDVLLNTDRVDGDDCGLIAGFDLPDGGTIGLQVGLSYYSIEHARSNLNVTLGKSFAEVRKDASRKWVDFLNKIKIEVGTEDQRTLFYTGLYRSVVVPNDVTGDVAGWPEDVPQFWNIYCIWDTYITSSPLFTLIVPEK
jgi:predicted alpha-1,2-mannosidase